MRTRSDGEGTWPLLTKAWTFSLGADMPADPPGGVYEGPSGQPHQARGLLDLDSQPLQAALPPYPGECLCQGPDWEGLGLGGWRTGEGRPSGVAVHGTPKGICVNRFVIRAAQPISGSRSSSLKLQSPQRPLVAAALFLSEVRQPRKFQSLSATSQGDLPLGPSGVPGLQRSKDGSISGCTKSNHSFLVGTELCIPALSGCLKPVSVKLLCPGLGPQS